MHAVSQMQAVYLGLRLLHEDKCCGDEGTLLHVVHCVCQERVQQVNSILHPCTIAPVTQSLTWRPKTLTMPAMECGAASTTSASKTQYGVKVETQQRQDLKLADVRVL